MIGTVLGGIDNFLKIYLFWTHLNTSTFVTRHQLGIAPSCLSQQIAIFYSFLSLTEDGTSVKITTLNPSASDGNVVGAVCVEKPTTTLNSSELTNN